MENEAEKNGKNIYTCGNVKKTKRNHALFMIRARAFVKPQTRDEPSQIFQQ